MQALAQTQQTLADIISHAWEGRDGITANTHGEVREAVEAVLADVDAGRLRVAHKTENGWQVNQWVKQAILLSFRLNAMRLMPGSEGESSFYWDKVPVKWEGWREEEFKAAGFRAVPGAVARYGSYIARDVVLMPSFVNIGAYVDEGTMVDGWATIGSCAQIGKHCHISGGAGIGGVLEPLRANPVIIEDNCFIGARSEVAEGVIIEEGSVLAMGVYLSASTKIVNRETGEVTTGRIPPYSVVVPGNLPGKNPGDPSLYCAVIVKQVDAQTRSKTGINELLRGI